MRRVSRELIYLWLLLVLCQVLDGVITFFAVTKFGLDVEGNPLFRTLMSHYGALGPIVAAKVFVVILTALVIAACARWPRAEPVTIRGFWFLLGAHVVMVWQWCHSLWV